MVMGKAIRCNSGLEAGEAADNSLELLPDLIEMLQALFETEVVEVVRAELVA